MANFAAYGVVLLLLSFATCAVAFFSPFWMRFLHDGTSQGLWGRCPEDKACIWYHEENFALQRVWPVWYKGCQALYTMGIMLQFAGLCVAIFHVTCHCCKKTRNILIIIAVILLLSVLLMLISIALFAGMAYQEGDYKTSVHSSVSVLHWAYYVAIAGILATALTSGLFFIQGYRVAKELKGYE